MAEAPETSVICDSPLNVEQVAAVLGCSPRTVWRMVDRREIIAPRRCGRRIVRWSAKELQTWIAIGCPGACDDA
jgi:excisionase family DNA binding protein